MGRMKRQRRFKSCDPFTKSKGANKDASFDLPPKEADDDHFKETKSFKRMQMAIEGVGSKYKLKVNTKNEKKVISKGKSKKKQNNETTNASSLQRLPNESKKDFFHRLDQNVQEAVNATMKESKTLRKKRKQHLKMREEKKKQKKRSVEIDEESPMKDAVCFGETVEQPPDISVAPRKASQINKVKDLKLMALLKNDRSKTEENTKTLKTENEKELLNIERQRAIDAYRLMKKRKEARYET